MTTTDWILAIGMTLVCVSLLTMAVARRGGKKPGAIDIDERLDLQQRRRQVADDLQTLCAEIEQAAGRLNKRIDEQSQRLEDLLRAADLRIAELRRLSGQPSPPSPGESAPGEPNREPVAPPTPPADPLSEKVYQLADQGRQAIDIARALNEHVGKIELILALRQA